MQVTKLDRLGYMVEFPDFILIFDYTRDQEHHVEKTLRHHPDKPAIFFVTHNHQYTFDTDIFNMAQNHSRVYVLSNDIPTREIHDDMPIDWMSAGDRIENVANCGINVEAVKVGGDGVGYYVNAGGTTILYGGAIGEDTDQKHTDVLIRRIATEHPSETVAIVPASVAGKFAASAVYTYEG